MGMDRFAILNYWSRFKSSDILVGVGDEVIAATDEFNLTKGRKYKIQGVYSINEISVINDVSVKEIYTVEHFILMR